MNRPIKFRAWDIFGKRWLNISSLQISNDGSVFGVWELKDGDNQLYGLHQVVISQSTGLLDKNGKEIYEGDIVSHVEDVVQEIIAGSERTELERIFTEVKMPEIYLAIGGDLPDADELEIIGDIYQNPELVTPQS